MASNISAAQRRVMRMNEKLVEFLLFLCAASSVLITAAIVGVLVYESYGFFRHVPIVEFLTDTM